MSLRGKRAPKAPVAIVLSLDAARDALDRAADAIRRRVLLVRPDERPWSVVSKPFRQTYRLAAADAVDALGDPATATRLREIIALLETV